MLHRHAHLQMHHSHHHRRADDTNPFIKLWNEINPFGNVGSGKTSTGVTQNQASSSDDGFTQTGSGDGDQQQGSLVVETVFQTVTGQQSKATATADNSPANVVTVWTTSTQRPTTQPKAASPTTSSGNQKTASSSTDLPTQITNPNSQSDVPSTLALASNSPSATVANLAATGTSSADGSANSGDMGTAAKAGIAIGVLLGVLAVAVLGFFFYNRRRKAAESERLDDEKSAPTGFVGGTTANKSLPKAPRLSLRPVTQLFPGFGGGNNNTPTPVQHPDRRASRGAMMALSNIPGGQYNRSAPTTNPWERPGTNASNHQDNPFGRNAERMNSPTNEPVSPVGHDVGVAHSPAGHGAISPVDGAVAVGAVGAAALSRKTSIRKNGAPEPLDLTVNKPLAMPAVPASPAGTEFSMNEMAPGQMPGPSAGAAAIAAAGGPQNSAVHRVQLDFKPTLEDEMELRAGHLVRLLHEYDDGWALCIRLDRSEQGVVPRTCLSTRPVKPRPQQNGQRGPPVNPQRGPGGPGYGPNRGPPGYGPPQGRRMSPPGPPGPGYRPESPSRMGPPPAGRPGPGPGPYPGPQQGRPQSPGPRYDQGRSQSPNGMNRRMSPPGPSGMNQQYRPAPGSPPTRKPVPGQAY